MYVYLIVLGISLFFSKLAVNAKSYPALAGTYRLFAIFSFLPFAVNSMFRGQVGTDWPIYDSYYYYINHGIKTFSEPLFNFLNRVLYKISPNSELLFANVSFITLLFFFLGIYQQSEMIPFSILLFFLSNKYFMSLNQIRQMMAMSIFVFAFKFIEQRRMGAYMFSILIACLIHTSTIIYIPIYFLYGKDYSAKKLIDIFFLYCICLPAVKVLFPAVVKFTRFAWYFDSQYNLNNFYVVGFAVSIVVFVLHIVLLYRQEKQIKKECRYIEDGDVGEDRKKMGFMALISMLPCMLLLMSSVLPQVSRIAEGFAVIQIFSFPAFFKREKNRYVRMVAALLLVALYGSKLIYDVYKNHWYGVLPYHTIFFSG